MRIECSQISLVIYTVGCVESVVFGNSNKYTKLVKFLIQINQNDVLSVILISVGLAGGGATCMSATLARTAQHSPALCQCPCELFGDLFFSRQNCSIMTCVWSPTNSR
jgi:hypothetical protein